MLDQQHLIHKVLEGQETLLLLVRLKVTMEEQQELQELNLVVEVVVVQLLQDNLFKIQYLVTLQEMVEQVLQLQYQQLQLLMQEVVVVLLLILCLLEITRQMELVEQVVEDLEDK